MRTGGWNAIERFSRGPCFANHLKVSGSLEKGAEAGTNDLVIIEKKDPDTQLLLLGLAVIRANSSSNRVQSASIAIMSYLALSLLVRGQRRPSCRTAQ